MIRARLITLDLTGTVFRFKEPPFAQYKLLALQRGLESDSDAIKVAFYNAWKEQNISKPHFGATSDGDSKKWWFEIVHKTMKGALKDCYNYNTVENIAEEVYDYYASPMPYVVYPDAKKFLEEPKEARVAAVTNFDKRIHNVLRDLGIADHFNYLVCSEDAKASKPDPMIFQTAMKLSGLSRLQPMEIVHVGDDIENDYHGAKNLGWNAILLDRNARIPRDYSMLDPYDVCSDFSELRSRIKY